MREKGDGCLLASTGIYCFDKTNVVSYYKTNYISFGGEDRMEAIKMLNLALRFVLELALLAAFGYWGFKTGGRLPARWLLGIGVPLLAAMIWGMFLSPKASLPLEAPLRLAI